MNSFSLKKSFVPVVYMVLMIGALAGTLVLVRQPQLIKKRAAVTSSDSTLYFIHSDNLGSPNLVTDSTGSTVSRQAYYPYGSTRSSEGNSPTQRQYTGQISDVDNTGLYYYNARYYHPAIGKFTQADTAGGYLNRYLYVGNNPVNRVDPTGHQDESCNNLLCQLITGLLTNSLKIHYGFWNGAREYAGGYDLVYKEINWQLDSLDTSQMTDFEKIKTYSSFLFENVQYNESITEAVNLDAPVFNLNAYNSPISTYRTGNFVCLNFTKLMNEVMKYKLPDVPFATAVVLGPYSHVFNLFTYNNKLYMVDPTNNVGPMPLLEYMKVESDSFWWETLVGFIAQSGGERTDYFSRFNNLLSETKSDYRNIQRQNSLNELIRNTTVPKIPQFFNNPMKSRYSYY